MTIEYLLTLILDLINMPVEFTTGILALYRLRLLQVFMSMLHVCAVMIAIGLRRSFFEQSARAVAREPIAVVASGVVTYGLALALTLVFLLSVAGFPVAALVLILMSFLIFIGQAALSVMLGALFADKFNRMPDSYQSAFLGSLVVEGVKYIPYINLPFQYLILPVLALGAVVVGFTNGFMKKKFYSAHEAVRPVANRADIRGAILRHAHKRG